MTNTLITSQANRLAAAAKAVATQEKWIADRGATLASYITWYGSVFDADHYGDGGEAIYAADIAALDKLVQELNFAVRAASR